LFVIEDKDYSGWIFAGERDRYWTAIYFGDRYQFQNPLHQNFGHVKALEELLGIDASKMHSAVVFRGRFEFKTPVPRGVFQGTCAPWVAGKTEVLLDAAEVDMVLGILKSRAMSGFFAAAHHASAVRSRYGSSTTCPKCGGTLVPRIAIRGPMPGTRFLGCSNYPGCKYIKR